MVNVGTGNVVLQHDDMLVPHKGVAMAFQRTYNSQSRHDVNADDAGSFLWKPPGLYGNGWTNTFDASLVRTAAGASTLIYSVFDGDGTRYDYTYVNGVLVPAAGDHSSLVSDGQCGFLWTKKSGTIYYFYRPSTTGPCANMPSSGGLAAGYAGRLYQIIGRNRNTYVTFTYSWDNGDASVTGKVNGITATTESGMTATLSFADVNGHRLLQTLTFPDGTTNVQYGYDGSGNLVSVTQPANNTAGTRPQTGYGYQTIGSDQILENVSSPRWCSGSPSGCGYDGAWVYFGFSGTSAAASTLGEMAYAVTVNPTIPDGTNTSLYRNYQPDGENQSAIRFDYYTTGVTTPTLRDTDGHMANWVVDGSGRPTQTQVCTASTNQGQQCTGTWLVTNQSWDASNDLLSTTDERGYETDYAYDANGNTIAIGEPQTTTSSGTFRPTKLFDYDSFSNVTAYCDEAETHLAGADWTSSPAASDSLCSSAAGSMPHARATFTFPSYEPNGEVSTMTTPSGYTWHVGYSSSQQAGNDFGLPTSLTGDTYTQPDGSGRTPAKNVWYDAAGTPRCYSAGQGTWVVQTDALERTTAVADPDDTSANSGSVCAKSSGQSGWNTQTTATYYPDGTLQSTQSSAERAVGVSTAYAYDLDGNLVSRTTHHGCVANQSCAAGTTQQWYDGADRLVETKYPLDTNSPLDFPWMVRSLYDISKGAGMTTLTGTAVTAYGNQFEVEKSTPAGWTDVQFGNSDALDRLVKLYQFAPCPDTGSSQPTYCSNTPFATTYAWDAGPQALGLLSTATDGLGETKAYAYSPLGQTTAVQYTGDGGVTPALQYTYDAAGRLASANASAVGTQSYTYTSDGAVHTVQEPSLVGSGTRTYTYNGDGSLQQVDIADALFTQAQLFRYSYRADGLLANERFGLGGSILAYSYLDGGRLTSVSDPGGSPARTQSYATNGLVSSYSIPSGSYSGLSYDAEGDLAGFTGYGGVAVTNTFNVRGDQIAQAFSPNPVANGFSTWPAYQYQSVQGVMIQATSEHWDGRTGAVLSLGAPVAYDAIGRMTQFSGGLNVKTFTYDAEDRLTSGSTDQIQATGNCGSGRTIQGVRAGGNGGYTYGPDGNIVQSVDVAVDGSRATNDWHWLGDMPLYRDSSSVVGLINADDAGVLPPGGGTPNLTVYDRELNGLIASRHNSTGHASWTAPNSLLQKCVDQNPPPASPGYTDPTITMTPDTPDGSTIDDNNSTISPNGRAWVAALAQLSTSSSAVAQFSGEPRMTMSSRPTIANPNCPSGWSYADGDHECLANIGGTGGKFHNDGGSPNDGGGGGGSTTTMPKFCATHAIVQQSAFAFMVGGQKLTVINQDHVYNYFGPYFGFAIPDVKLPFVPMAAPNVHLDGLHSYDGTPVDPEKMFTGATIVDFGGGRVLGGNVLASPTGTPLGAYGYGLGFNGTLGYGGGFAVPSFIPFVPAKSRLPYNINVCNLYNH